MKELSIAIINWNSWDYARRCLESIRNAIGRELVHEIIFVDNASMENRLDEIRSEFKDLSLIVFRNSNNLGFSKACNQIIRVAQGRFILLVNPDVTLSSNSISKPLGFLNCHPTVGVLGCRLLNSDGSLQRWTGGRFPSVQAAFNHYFFLSLIPLDVRFLKGIYLSRETSFPEEVDWVSGAFMFLNRNAIEQVGFFSEDFFMYAEDMDLCFRMKQAGWKVVYFPETEVVHRSGSSIAQTGSDRYWRGLLSLSVFHERHSGGALSRVFFDLITAIGFLIRFILFALFGILIFRKNLLQQASISWNFFLSALKILIGRSSFRQHGIVKPVIS